MKIWPRNGADASHLKPGNIYITHSPERGKIITAEAEVKVWSEADVGFRRVVSISLKVRNFFVVPVSKSHGLTTIKKMKASVQVLRLCIILR